MNASIRIHHPVPPFVSEQNGRGPGSWWSASQEFDTGQRIAISGPSGSGKSSALKQLGGLMPSAPGTVFRNGQDLSAASIETLSGLKLNTGILLQDFHLLENLSAEENLKLRASARGERYPAVQTAEQAQALGLKPHLHKPVRQLSAGQKQRLALLRAMLLPTPWLFLDEPFSNLDTLTRATAIELVETFLQKHGSGLLITTLDPADNPFGCDPCLTA